MNGQIIGGVWVRKIADEIKGYGYIDNKKPEFAISVYFEKCSKRELCCENICKTRLQDN
ncbi:hypothetical protein LA52FAK_06950 [Desulforhopalus sp. 52FAK]